MVSEITKHRIHKLRLLFGLDSDYSVWEYGECNNIPARRNKVKRNVQMELTQTINGQKHSRWINFDPSWWELFNPALT